MEINGLTLTQFQACAWRVSREKYGWNIIVHNDAHDRPASKDGTPHCTARLAVTNSRGPGSRTTWNGRHGPYACWHAYRDVLAEVFRRYPDAVVRAGHGWRVTYRGLTGFLATYPGTASVVIGSEFSPVTMPELCECPPSAIEFPRGTPAYGEDYTAEFARRRAARDTAVSEPPGYQHYTEADFESGAFGPAGDEDVSGSRYWENARGENADYVSPAVERASQAYTASARLLGEGDKPADPWVFGPEH